MTMLRAFCCFIATISLAACNTVGVHSIDGARSGYNEAVVNSLEEQTLLNLVRLRYVDPPLFLEIGDIIAKYEMTYTGGTGAKLVKGSAPDEGTGTIGLSFKENPTITYTPLQGEKFARQLLTPIDPPIIVSLAGTGLNFERVFRTTVEQFGDHINAPSASGTTPSEKPDYEAFKTYASGQQARQAAGNLSITLTPTKPATTKTVETTTPQSGGGQVKTTKTEMDSPSIPGEITIETKIPDARDYSSQTFTIRQNALPKTSEEKLVTSDAAGSAGFRARSLMGVMHYLSNGVVVPEVHLKDGLAIRTTQDGVDWARDMTDKLLSIESSSGKPKEKVLAAVKYRGHWFYIRDNDLESKQTFNLLLTLIALQSGNVDDILPTTILAL